jgi:hypothetical protein
MFMFIFAHAPWTLSIDTKQGIGQQYGYGHSAWARACRMDIDMDMQLVHGPSAAWPAWLHSWLASKLLQ